MSAGIEGATHPDIPDKNWENPFPDGWPLHDLFEDVVSDNRDLIMIVDDFWGRRGTGKTIASMQLAGGMDQTTQGLTFEKCTLKPQEVRNAYSSQPKRSGLVLDEGEVGASNRQAMSNVNQALREVMSMARVEEKYLVVNAPLKGFLDKDILKLADVWVSMVRKGLALVHFLEWETYSEQLLTPKKQWIEFSDIPKGTDLRGVYNSLTEEKRRHIEGEEGGGYVPMKEHREKLQKAREESRREQRDELIRDLFRHPEIDQSEVSQRMVGEAVGVSQSTVSNIVQGDA